MTAKTKKKDICTKSMQHITYKIVQTQELRQVDRKNKRKISKPKTYKYRKYSDRVDRISSVFMSECNQRKRDSKKKKQQMKTLSDTENKYTFKMECISTDINSFIESTVSVYRYAVELGWVPK